MSFTLKYRTFLTAARHLFKDEVTQGSLLHEGQGYTKVCSVNNMQSKALNTWKESDFNFTLHV